MRMRRHLVFTLLVAFTLTVPLATDAIAKGQDARGGVRDNKFAKTRLKQDPAFVAAKNNGTLKVNFCYPDPCPPTPPSAYTLSTADTQYVIEPEGAGDKDDRNPRVAFTDSNYWSFCTAGASAVTVSYMNGGTTKLTAWPAGFFIEPLYNPPQGSPRVSTYWASSDWDATTPTYFTKGRNFLMYMAEQVFPPSYGYPGVVDFYSVSGTLADMRDAVNWEGSGHAGNWANYFYVDVGKGSLTEATFHSDIKIDIGSYKAAVIVIVHTDYLPGWDPNLNAHHAITVVGYNDNNSTYTYIDTCGGQCGSNSDNAVHTIGRQALYDAMVNYPFGGIVW